MKKVLLVMLALLLNACVVPYHPPYNRGYVYSHSVPRYSGTYYPRPYYRGHNHGGYYRGGGWGRAYRGGGYPSGGWRGGYRGGGWGGGYRGGYRR